MKKRRVFLVLCLTLAAAWPWSRIVGKEDPCVYFFSSLAAVPHGRLSRRDGKMASLWDGKMHSGCEVDFTTTMDLLSGKQVPAFEATEGKEMYRRGWRANNTLVSDGPGTGIFGIERGSVLCLVRHEQPAFLDDNGHIVQSSTLRMTIQCREK